MGRHFLLQEIFLTQESNPCLLHWQVDSLPSKSLGKPPLEVLGANKGGALQRSCHSNKVAPWLTPYTQFVWSAESVAIYPSAVLLLKLCGCLLTVMHFFPILSVLVDFCLHYTIIII